MRAITHSAWGYGVDPQPGRQLHGVKLNGAWAFTRTGGDWLLVKVKDADADPDLDLTVTEPRSVLSGLTIEEMAAS